MVEKGRVCIVATPKFRAMLAEIVAALGYRTATQAVYAAVIEMHRKLPAVASASANPSAE